MNLNFLYVRWAVRHLANARQFQSTCIGNSCAMQLHGAIENALKQLAETDPNWAEAIELERELAEFGYAIRQVD